MIQVIDFSKAQREGFIEAVTNLFLSNEDPKNKEELRDAEEKLIQGCKKHFRRSITRYSRISSVVSIFRRDEFIIKAQKLMEIKLLNEFQSIVQWILDKFPNTTNQIEYQLQKPYTQMIFPTYMSMDSELWEALPTMTNAQESLHFQLYHTAGHDKRFFEELKSLYSQALSFEDNYKDKQSTV